MKAALVRFSSIDGTLHGTVLLLREVYDLALLTGHQNPFPAPGNPER